MSENSKVKFTTNKGVLLQKFLKTKQPNTAKKLFWIW